MTSRHSLNRRQRRYVGREIRKGRRLASQMQSYEQFAKAYNEMVDAIVDFGQAVAAGLDAFAQAYSEAMLKRARKDDYVVIGETPSERNPSGAAQNATVRELTPPPAGAEPSGEKLSPQTGAERRGFDLEDVPVWIDEPADWGGWEDR